MSDAALIPPPPTGEDVRDWLRWVVYVMDDSDTRMGFVASVLSHHCKYGELTERQSTAANRMISSVKDRYDAGSLDIQA